ncbi:gamma-aminobutyric acid receptor subunit gamma-2 [Plakobranchus ocellatus]|uniref:Gamma-aminobutyric acid receptor subunit gamma-2 n=1 Tax=Plakobranchus ocellatus TaxID=259542 RepID=A0AAV4DCY2_9GAST|nr:gamma-aminobutyric acid receptor subunit gamma-2 [Plakobranchus ocellatus]
MPVPLPSTTHLHAFCLKPVRIRVVFLRIVEIDTVGQQFEAEVYIEARWTEPRLQGFSLARLAGVEFHQCWDPRLKILNIFGDLDMEQTSMVLRYEPDFTFPVLTYMWHVKGIFRERMELQHFPFDVQELSIMISSDLPAEQVDLVEEPVFDSLVNLGALQFLILALTLTLLAVDPTLNDRLIMLLTLFLTAVAFKLVIKSSLPNISYLTYLDMYVVFAMIYLFLQGAECALMIHLAKFRESEQVREYDEIAQSCLIAFLIFFHICFIIFIEWTVLARRRRMVSLDHDSKIARLRKQEARKKRQEGVGAREATAATE